MFDIFLIIHAILAIALIVVILLQRSDGGALGGIGGGNFSGMLTGRSSANFLTKLTAVLAAEHLAKQLITGGENKLAFLDRAPKLGWGLGAVWLDWVLPVAEVLWQQHPDHEEVEGRDVKGGEVNY